MGRYGVVAINGKSLIGSPTGLAYKNGAACKGWLYLTDLFIEKPYRRQGLRAALLGKLEARVAALGVRHIWTETAGYEAPGFYKKQGYNIVFEQENYYATGHNRVLLHKVLSP